MSEVFSSHRLWLLIRGDFVAGYRSLLVVFGALAGVILVAALVTQGWILFGGGFYRTFFGLALFAWGLVASSRAFRPLHDRTRNEAFLLVPASSLEKMLARLLAVTVGLASFLLAFTALVSLVVETLNLLLSDGRYSFFNPFEPAVLDWILVYFFLQSFYFLGGAWFRRAHFVKTTLALTLATAAFVAFTAVTLHVVSAGYRVDVGDVLFALGQLEGAAGIGTQAALVATALLVAVACWWIAWLRVKEVQVSDGV